MQQAHTAGGKWAIGGAAHPAIDLILHHFIERCRTGGHQTDSE